MNMPKLVTAFIVGLFLVALTVYVAFYLLISGGFDGIGIAGYKNKYGSYLFIIAIVYLSILYYLYILPLVKKLSWYWLLCSPYVAIVSAPYLLNIDMNSPLPDVSYAIGPLIGALWIVAMYKRCSWRWMAYPLVASLITILMISTL